MKIILLSLLLCVCFVTIGQNPVNRSSSTITAVDQRNWSSLNYKMPVMVNDTSDGLKGGIDSIGLLIWVKAQSKMYVRDTVATGGHKWKEIGSGIGDFITRHDSIPSDDSSFIFYNNNGYIDTVVFVGAGGGSGGGSGGGGSGGSYTASSGVVLQGSNFKIQDTLSGAGTRLQWTPGKNAFRAGYVSGTQWNIDSIGQYSAAFGQSNKAKGNFSFVAGANNSATVNVATAFGSNVIASGNSSFATGQTTVASGQATFTAGFQSNAAGDYSASFGNSSYSSGPISFTFGASDTASGTSSFAAGQQVRVRSPQAIGLGYQLVVKHPGGTVVGTYNDTTGPVSGDTYNVGNRAFQVGIGMSGIARKNALTVLYTGKVAFDQYGTGTFTGTTAKNLAVTSAGEVIEVTPTVLRLTTAQRIALKDKEEGDIVYDKGYHRFYFWNGTIWRRFN